MHLRRCILCMDRAFRVFIDPAQTDRLQAAGNYTGADCVH
jgi:hypothetical protein